VVLKLNINVNRIPNEQLRNEVYTFRISVDPGTRSEFKLGTPEDLPNDSLVLKMVGVAHYSYILEELLKAGFKKIKEINDNTTEYTSFFLEYYYCTALEILKNTSEKLHNAAINFIDDNQLNYTLVEEFILKNYPNLELKYNHYDDLWVSDPTKY